MPWHHYYDEYGYKLSCNNTGLMSYGDPPLQWSECSKKDFKTYYNHATKVQKLTWCMERKNFFTY